MPPPESQKQLFRREKELLRQWIRRLFQTHWAFVPPGKETFPKATKAHPIDFFIDRELAKQKLKRTRETDRTILIRRVTFDLTGLPSPAEVDAFVNDKSANAYEKLIDRLLDSQRFGERMALYSMDLARQGRFQRDARRRSPRHVAVARLGHPCLQRQHAHGSVHDRADRRRSDSTPPHSRK